MTNELLLCAKVLFGLLLSPILAYVFARAATLAYFHSRSDYELIISKRRQSKAAN